MPGRRFVFLFLIAIMSSSSGTSNIATADQPSSGKFLTFTHAGEERKYLLHLPEELPEKAPLVFILHGYRGDARDYMAELGVKRIADKNGFALCVPQGANFNYQLPGCKRPDSRFMFSQSGRLRHFSFHMQVTSQEMI